MSEGRVYQLQGALFGVFFQALQVAGLRLLFESVGAVVLPEVELLRMYQFLQTRNPCKDKCARSIVYSSYLFLLGLSWRHAEKRQQFPKSKCSASL